MMRWAISLGSMCLLLAACGGGGGDDGADDAGATQKSTVPAAQFSRRGDELCRQLIDKEIDARIQQRLQAIQTSSASEEEKLRRAVPLLAEQLSIITAFRRDFERLGMPTAHANDVHAMLEKARSAEEELDRAIESARSGDLRNSNDALHRYAGFSAQSASVARDSELNFAICGSGA